MSDSNVGTPGVYDLSPLVNLDGFEWWFDQPLSSKPFMWGDQAMAMSEGCSCNVNVTTMPQHVGSHADGVRHFDDDGEPVEAIDPLLYEGRCQLLDVESWIDDGEIPATAFEERIVDGVERVLVHTGSFSWEDMNRDFAVLSEDAIRYLASRAVKLVCVDTISVDMHDSKKLPNHNLLRESGIAIVEGLVLTGVPEGQYVLHATPIRVTGDAAMCRARLRTQEAWRRLAEW